MNATGAKWIALTVLGLVSFTLGVIPIKISSVLRWTRHGCQRSPRSQLLISLLLCFGAGVLLATSLTHMLPEVKKHIEDILQAPDTWPPLKAIPLTETLLALGFFLVYGLDELVHTVLYRRQHSHHEGHSHKNGHSHIHGENATPESHSSHGPGHSHGHGHGHGHGHSHCPPSSLTEREPRPSSQNSLLRQSAGQHSYGTSDCHGNHSPDIVGPSSGKGESTPLLGIEESTSVKLLSVTSGLLALLALSIHSVTEGLAIGLQDSASNVFFLLGAVATHKFVIAFCLGMELSSGWGASKVSVKFHVAYMIVFSGMSALGILLGLLLMGSVPQGLFIQALQAVAAGTLLYVTFCEVLPRERAKCHAGLAQFGAVFSGFIIMLTLDTLVPHDADHESPVTGTNLTSVN